MTLTTSLFGELRDLFRCKYDPVKDKNELPVRKVHQPVQAFRQVVENRTSGFHKGPDGKMYARTIEKNDSGADVYVLDSNGVSVEVDVPKKLTKYDYLVFAEYQKEVKSNGAPKYPHFDVEKYKIIKEQAFCVAVEGRAMQPKEAARLDSMKNIKCGERYLKDYFKAMREAQEMYIKKAPLDVREEG